jgi:dihydroorotate dehydrogenase electron transfer subunit
VASAEQANSDPTRSSPIRARARVVSNESEGAANRRIVLEIENWPSWKPGQFVMLSPGPESEAERYDPLLPRPMAIFASNAEAGRDRIEVLYKVEGRGTRLIAGASVGDYVRVVGPLGRGFEIPARGSRSILVGGGTGAASLYGLAKDAMEAGTAIVILGAQRAELLMAAGDFEKLGVELRIATEDGSRGTQGLVTHVLAEMLDEKAAAGTETTLFACGPTAMMRACNELALSAGVRCRVALENRMACGFGVCLGCAVPMAGGGFSLVCNQGPVYDAADLDWPGIP